MCHGQGEQSFPRNLQSKRPSPLSLPLSFLAIVSKRRRLRQSVSSDCILPDLRNSSPMSTANNQQGMLKAEFSVCLPKTQQRPMKQQLLMQLYCLLFAQTVAWLCAVWQNFLLPCEDAFRISSNFWSPGFVGVEKAFFMLFYLLSALYILSALSEVFPVLPKKLEWIHHYILYLSTQLHFHYLDVHVKSYARNKKYDTTTIPAKPRYGDNGLVLTSPNTKGTHLRKNIFVLSKAGSGASTLIGGSHHGRGNVWDAMRIDVHASGGMQESLKHCRGGNVRDAIRIDVHASGGMQERLKHVRWMRMDGMILENRV